MNPYEHKELPAAQPVPPASVGGDSLAQDPTLRMVIPIGRSLWAIAAGYLGLFSLVCFPAPFALVVSIVAIMDIRSKRAKGQEIHGMGRAIFGLVMGLLGSLFLGFGIVSAFLVG